MRLLSIVLALGMVAPAKARARSRSPGDGGPPGRPPTKQPRRRADRTPPSIAPQPSPGGDHVVEVQRGAVLVDGRRVHPRGGTVEVLTAPLWRADGGALAWLERGGGETRLVVLPSVDDDAEALAWTLPHVLGGDRVHWLSPNRVVIGPEALAPRAVASWSE